MIFRSHRRGEGASVAVPLAVATVVESAVDEDEPGHQTPVMPGTLPPWVKSHGAEHDAAEGREFAAMSPAERWRVLAQLSRLSARLLAANERRDAVLELRDERSEESLATWRRLMRLPRG